MSHTPGPWNSKPFGDSFAAMADDKRVAYCYGVFADWPKDVAEANARLIAAAPDLLEALKNIENDDGSIPGTIWAMCIAAIQKAEGR